MKQPVYKNNCMITYVPQWISTTQGDLSAHAAYSETRPPVANDKKRCRCHLHWAEIQRGEEERNTLQKTSKLTLSPNLDFLGKVQLMIISVAHISSNDSTSPDRPGLVLPRCLDPNDQYNIY